VSLDRAEAVITEVFSSAWVDKPTVVQSPDVFRALWRAHRTRAVHDGDLALVVTASVLLDAIARVPAGHLVAAKVTIGGEAYAAWVDVGRGALLGLARPAEVYLAG
jgi:hypothetical protein